MVTAALAVVVAVVALADSSTDETVVSNAASSQETTTSAPEETTSTTGRQETTTSVPPPAEPPTPSSITVAPELKSGTGFPVTYANNGDQEWMSVVQTLRLHRDDGELLYTLNAAWQGEQARATPAGREYATTAAGETMTTARTLEMSYTLPTERLSGSYKLCGALKYSRNGPDPTVTEPFCRVVEIVP